MPFKATMRQINDPTAASAFQKLQAITSNAILSIKTKYNISRIAEKLAKEGQRLEKIRVEMLDAYLQKDEKGKPVFVKDPTTGKEDKTRYAIKEGLESEWREKFQQWMDTEIEIPCNPLKIADLMKVDFSTTELMSLEFMLTGFEELDEEPEAPAPTPTKLAAVPEKPLQQ